MKIARIDSIPLRIPFSFGGDVPRHWARGDWTSLNVLVVRVETDDGAVGYGEAFSYSCLPAVRGALDHMIAPAAIGADAADIAGLSRRLQQQLHLFGRYGIALFALSGLDIALWDAAARRAGVPLHAMLGGASHAAIPGYASLFRYGETEPLQQRCAQALAEGYRYVKLHEITEPCVAAARETLGDGVPMMVDTNCPWTPAEAYENAMRLKAYDPYWLEEPVFPPEDFASLARLRRTTMVRIAAGENACTAWEFAKMFEAGAVDFAQPSVTKVGGITEFRRVETLARAAGVAVMAHSPYFGPGFLASLHLAAAIPEPSLFERFHLDLEACLYPDWIHPVDGAFRVPDGPGLGVEPDPDVLREYRVTD